MQSGESWSNMRPHLKFAGFHEDWASPLRPPVHQRVGREVRDRGQSISSVPRGIIACPKHAGTLNRVYFFHFILLFMVIVRKPTPCIAKGLRAVSDARVQVAA